MAEFAEFVGSLEKELAGGGGGSGSGSSSGGSSSSSSSGVLSETGG